MTREEIIAAIRACVRKLGRVPSKPEFHRMSGYTEKNVYRRFGSFGRAIREAGFEPLGSGYRQNADTLLKDWGAVARELGKIPTKDEYTAYGKCSAGPFKDRWKSFPDVAKAFRAYVEATGAERQWGDVLALVNHRYPRLELRPEDLQTPDAAQNASGRNGASPAPSAATRRTNPSPAEQPRRKRHLMPGRPVYGEPLLLPGMSHAPVNEAGAMFAFGVLAPRLGFVVKRWQTAFPDCVAVREMAQGQWQDQNVEVEFYSRNFLAHGHDPKGCDVIVCWIHNWPECPKEIEVVELRKVVEEMQTLAPIH